ncbi:hypothetical protein JW916_15995 [Candidatus Sumerlaeota bacterium]|nr:hypothetical protein [Candidatus Sumerlaeota bacterium]
MNQRMSRYPIVLVGLLLLSMSLSGCHYASNRLYDFNDMFILGAGVIAETPRSGPWPPIVGVRGQITDFCNLGSYHFTGYWMEMDGRGFFIGPENRTELGIGPAQMIHIEQDYDKGRETYFKKADSLWAGRMAGDEMTWRNTPAKEVNYDFWADTFHLGIPAFPRGWQHWGTTSLQVGLGDPITHVGLAVRLGFDFSEFTDFILSAVGLDYKHDDLNKIEFKEKRERPN